MGKFTKLKKQIEQKEEEPPAAVESETSGDESSAESDVEAGNEQAASEAPKRAVLWTNRERVLVMCSRGADARTRHLMKDIKASRPILSFDSKFDEIPHLTLIKHSLIQTFGTPNHHPRSQPFVDHVFSFSVTPDNKIWFRNFQIVDETLQLQEIGPRFVLETIRIFDGSFEGAVLYDNPDYESPNAKRRALKVKDKGKSMERELHHKTMSAKSVFVRETIKEKLADPLCDDLFNTEKNMEDDKAKEIAEQIDSSLKIRGKRDKKAKKAKLG